ncbi:MAG: transglutaminase-like domain-containing protein [Pirellulales bacterium]
MVAVPRENWNSDFKVDRYQRGAMLLSLLSVIALGRQRSHFESIGGLLCESGFAAGLLLIGLWFTRTGSPTSRSWKRTCISVCLTLLPPTADQFFRRMGSGTGFEIVLIAALSWGAVAGAFLSTRRRTIGLSVIASGFVSLFTTFISEGNSSLPFVSLWGLICLWWMVTDSWQRTVDCRAGFVTRRSFKDIIAVAVGCGLFVIVTWSLSGVFPAAVRASIEWMPTSGGTGAYDSAARSGVGSGDAVVAARDHAMSFGAVESDLFLDSDQPNLYDMFSDVFGEPIVKLRTERTFALPGQAPPESDQRVAESKSGGSSFAVDRRPAKQTSELRDVDSRAVLRWIGRAHVRVAAERFTEFDGNEWLPSTGADSKQPQLISIEERPWFHYPETDSSRVFVGAEAEAVKFTGFRSARIPSAAGMQMWHVDRVDKTDFFAQDAAGNLSMTGRVHVPDLTVVRMINREVDRGELETSFRQFYAHLPLDREPTITASEKSVRDGLTKLAAEYDDESIGTWSHVESVIQRLRSEYRTRTPARAQEFSELSEFFVTKEGNDIHFATVATLVLRSYGYRTRFCAGFFVPGRTFTGSEETPLTAADLHTWPEIQVGPHTWIELEPCPDYPLPIHQVSWSTYLKAHASVICSVALLAIGLCGLCWYLRSRIFDGSCLLISPLFALLSDRMSIRLITEVMDWRCRLAGCARPPNTPLRPWLKRCLGESTADMVAAVNIVCDEADRLWFGSDSRLSHRARSASRTLLLRGVIRRRRSHIQTDSDS